MHSLLFCCGVAASQRIEIQPVDHLDVLPGTDVVFSVTVADGVGSLDYYWLKDGEVLTHSPKYSGIDTGTITVLSANEEDEGFYVCVAVFEQTNFFSNPASLTVRKLKEVV